MTESADELFRRLYTCEDPDCTATHVDFDTLPTAVFTEGSL